MAILQEFEHSQYIASEQLPDRYSMFRGFLLYFSRL